jgi:hypothetical protein
MRIVNLNDFLVRGTAYTMSLKEGGVLGDIVGTSIDTATAALQGVANVSNIRVSQAWTSFFVFDISFTYTGDGSDVAAGIYQAFADALSGMGYSWDYITTTGPDSSSNQGIAPEAGSGDVVQLAGIQNAIGDAASSLTKFVPSGSSLWAIAAIGLLAVFLLSGGAPAVRRMVA